MKKLSLLLLAICVTLAGATAGNDANAVYEFNPYAYDLTSTWNENTGKLTVNFKLNSAPNLDSDKGGRGMQIYAVDSKNNRYYILGPSEANIKASGKGKGPYSFEIDLSSGYDKNGKQIPFNEDLTWEVTVAGRPSTISGYNSPRFWNWSTSSDNNYKFQKRFISQGIAINTNPQSPNFGRIYISDGIKVAKTDAYGEAHGNSFHSYAKGRGVYMLEPDFFTFGNNGNPSTIGNTDNRKNGFVDPLEPWRIRTTDDGRVFVSSYSKSSATAVWELTSNAPYYRNWNAVLNKSDIGNRRVIGMDVKGSGSQLTLLVLCQGSGKELKCYEINLGTSTQYNSSTHTLTEKKVPSNINFYEDGINGHAQVAYGNGGAIWYSFGIEAAASKLYRVKADGTTTSYSYGSNYGGEGFLIKNNLLIKGFRTGSNNSGIYIYGINNDNPSASASYTVPEANTIGTGAWITDFALDYANNLYAASSYYGRVMPISLPYDGIRTTRAQTKFNFRLKAVPNILATDLRYDIVRGKNQYEFSFNVNTKPQEAQIRFYKSYDAMKNSLNAVNADNYDGTNNNKPLFVYNIPSDQLKQGRIAVKLGAVGGQVDDGVITNDRLPAGVLYWSVYVKTRESCVFAPIYQYGATTDATNGHHRKHIAVNNYPETDMFGSLIVAHNPSVTDDATRANRGLHIYGINPDGNSDDEKGNINNNTRYSKRAEYLNQNADGRLHYPRRLVVGHDGKVYVADEGTETASRTTQGGVIHEHGGVKVWDPANPNKFALFSDNRIGTATGVALYEHADGWKLYANNTYNEFSSHGNAYTKENQDNPASYGWNGFVGYVLDKYTSGHNGSWSSWGNNATEVALRRGDASGNFAFAAMDKGLWICQYREHTVALKTAIQQPLADNFEAYVLSFVPYGTDIRTWKSSESIGVKSYSNGTPVWDDIISPYSQTTTAPLQSTPGGGVAYKKTNGKEYVYVVNHDGNIAVLEITGWTGTGVSATPIIPVNNIKILATPEFTKADRAVSGTSTKWHTAYITSMCFDYAGNLITTTGKGYHDGPQDILVYTMPYDRVNAREIQAPNSCRMIPERIAHLDMDKEDLDELIEEHQKDHPTGCAVDLYRPLQGGMFNTICLPCTLDLKTLPEGHPLYKAELKEYTGLNLNTVGGEKVLELVFTDVSNKVIIANKPYIIQPEENYNSIIRFAGPLQLTNTTGNAVQKTEAGGTYSITYQGIIPFQNVEPKKVPNTGEILTLMLVADNRLAEMTTEGYMYGFRGYFELNQPLPKGMRTRITTSKGTATNTTIVVDGKKVNVEKFIREGRVCIRVGDTLYNINGEVIGR